MPPMAASIRLSVNNCAKIVLGVAPREARTAVSFWRLMPLATSRLATFIQAIRRMNPTAPSSSKRVSFRSLVRKSFLSGSTRNLLK
jgi:hypothetical protein